MGQNDLERRSDQNPVGDRAGRNGGLIASIIVVVVIVAGVLVWSLSRTDLQTASKSPASSSTVGGSRTGGGTGSTGSTGSGAQGG